MLEDEFVDPDIEDSQDVFHGKVWDVKRDTFRLPESDRPIVRDYVDHPGAVAIAAIDSQDRILLIQQYRHPIRARDWEVPAGLLDKPGEDPAVAAARELGEEAELRASDWHVLADQISSPGGMNETLRIYLARQLRPVPEGERFARDDEESGIVPRWTPLDEAFAAVRAGRLGNATTQLAVLHAHAARADDWKDLRPVDAPWPARDHLRSR